MRKFFGWLLACLVFIAAVWFVRLLSVAGELRALEPVSPGVCTAVGGIVGAEDIVIDQGSKTALVSSYDRRAVEAGEEVRGAIYAYDLEARALHELTAGFAGTLHPHGIDLYEEPDGVRLFVVNHDLETGNGHSVEIFSFRRGELAHLETIQGDLLSSPNDVVAVGPRSFYATNDHGRTEGFPRLAEEYFQLARSNVVYYDGSDFSVAAAGIAYANGIDISRFGHELYVASSTRMKLHLYTREPSDGALAANGTIDLGTGADNVYVDRHGMLWIGAHPKLLTFASHAKKKEKLAPSHVLWVDPDQGYDPPIRDVYVDSGEELAGSSVAVPWGSRLLIGSVFDDHFLDCERAGG